jgi:hypothetical protein
MPGCPNDEVMAAFTEGRLGTEEATRVHEHVDGCQSCQWLLKELAAGDTAAAPDDSPVVFAPGTLLGGRYRLERKLGNGGMGTVWAALHVGTNRPVALKVLRGSTPTARLRFLREARVLGRIDHPNLVPVRDVFEQGGVPILAMDLLVGESLGDRLRRVGRLPLDEVARLLDGAMAAIDFAHGAGIVHRDLKPDNLFVLASGEIRVLDFGIAKLLSTNDQMMATLTAAGEVLGTPPYMAPEQLRGETIDRRADIWAVGVILYECLAGKRPFSGPRFAQLFDSVTSGKREPLSGAPRDVTALIDEMLTVDLRARCADLKQARAVLQRHSSAAAPPAQRRRWLPIAALAGVVAAAAWVVSLSLHPAAPPLTVPAPSPIGVPAVAPKLSPAVAPSASPPPPPSGSACERAWGLEARVCMTPILAMREAAYRVGRELDKRDVDRRALDGCNDDACLLKKLQQLAPRTSVIDCAHAVSLDARTICHSLPLASLAGSLAAHYQAGLTHYATDHRRLEVPGPVKFSTDQKAWVIARHACGADPACLQKTMEDRISALLAIHRAFTD